MRRKILQYCKNAITQIILFAFIAFLSIQSVKAQLQPKPIISTDPGKIDIKSYTGVIAEQYANGSPKLWKTLVNGKAEGLWLEWYPDGTLRFKAYWKNDSGHGRWEYFHPNGKLRSESFYVQDIAQGIYRSYFENGQLQTDANYLNGNKNGEEFIYDVNGTRVKRNFYEDGQLVIDQPTLFEPGKISTLHSNEWGICFTPDGKTAYFTRRDANTKLKRIYEVKKNENGWSEPLIASFSTDEDESPFINSQGSKMFFASFRPLPDGSSTRKTDNNIWFMDKTPNGWSEPKPIAGGINQSMKVGDEWPARYEASPTTDKEGNLYYWSKSTKTKASNLFFAKIKADGSFEKPVELIEPSSHNYFDGSPILSPDGNVLFFSSDNRPEGLSGSDIYYAKKENGVWGKPKNLMPQLVNTYSDDGFPGFSPDGKYFFFSSTRAGNKDAFGDLIWDLYYIETKYLIIE